MKRPLVRKRRLFAVLSPRQTGLRGGRALGASKVLGSRSREPRYFRFPAVRAPIPTLRSSCLERTCRCRPRRAAGRKGCARRRSAAPRRTLVLRPKTVSQERDLAGARPSPGDPDQAPTLPNEAKPAPRVAPRRGPFAGPVPESSSALFVGRMPGADGALGGQRAPARRGLAGAHVLGLRPRALRARDRRGARARRLPGDRGPHAGELHRARGGGGLRVALDGRAGPVHARGGAAPRGGVAAGDGDAHVSPRRLLPGGDRHHARGRLLRFR